MFCKDWYDFHSDREANPRLPEELASAKPTRLSSTLLRVRSCLAGKTAPQQTIFAIIIITTMREGEHVVVTLTGQVW